MLTWEVFCCGSRAKSLFGFSLMIAMLKVELFGLSLMITMLKVECQYFNRFHSSMVNRVMGLESNGSAVLANNTVMQVCHFSLT